MIKKEKNLGSIWEEIFTKDKVLYSRLFYTGGIFAAFLIFFAFLSFFLYFLAEETEPPKNVRITNISENSLTITWQTEKKTKGLVIYAPSETPKILRPIALLSLPSNQRVYDDFPNPSKYHSVTLKKLKPNSYYLYRISTGLRTYKIDNNNNLLPAIKTAPLKETILPPKPIYGQVKNRDGSPVKSTLVFLYLKKEISSLPQSTFLSTITNNNGYYLFDLTSLRKKDLSEISNFLPNEEIRIFTEGEDGQGETFFFAQEKITKVEDIYLENL